MLPCSGKHVFLLVVGVLTLIIALGVRIVLLNNALPALSHVVLFVYQSAFAAGVAADASRKAPGYRRRGLNTAVTGQDVRASRGETQAMLCIAAVIGVCLSASGAAVSLRKPRSVTGGNAGREVAGGG